MTTPTKEAFYSRRLRFATSAHVVVWISFHLVRAKGHPAKDALVDFVAVAEWLGAKLTPALPAVATGLLVSLLVAVATARAEPKLAQVALGQGHLQVGGNKEAVAKVANLFSPRVRCGRGLMRGKKFRHFDES